MAWFVALLQVFFVIVTFGVYFLIIEEVEE